MKYKTLNGRLFRELLDYGIRNLALHSEEVNDLNIFPVPDGDTGTNMVTTLRNGYRALDDGEDSLSALAGQFATAVVYGARGNSGVIVSQFFKGFAETLADAGEEADVATVVHALECGVRFAYRAVTHPAEGTILTVVREATETVTLASCGDLAELIAVFLKRAHVSLANTPNLLPVLKSAGVVDSGGVGIVYVFEGVYKRLTGETVENAPSVASTEAVPQVDYTRFNRESTFPYGYCTEGLLQITNQRLAGVDFDYNTFMREFETLGDSIVSSFDGEKLKFHIHTDAPERILSYVHAFGEFLSLKIENMSVQHSALARTVTVSSKKRNGPFAVVAVASDEKLGALFLEMGADAVVTYTSGNAPSTQDFLKAFEETGAERIVVFPNNGNLILASEQARDLAEGRSVFVIPSRSVADCYAALAMLDFEAEDMEALTEEISEIVSNVRAVSITRAVKDAKYGDIRIEKNDMIAVSGADVLAVGDTLLDVALRVTEQALDEECDTVTVFRGAHVPESVVGTLSAFVAEHSLYTETVVVETDEELYDLILAFE